MRSFILFEKKQKKCNKKITKEFGSNRKSRCMALFSLLSLQFVIKEYIFIEKQVTKSAKKKFAVVFNGVLLISFIILFVMQIKQITTYKQLHFGFQMSQEKAVDFLLKNNLQGNIFNNPSVGNYLIYRLYPNKKVFIDSRPEAYPSLIFDEYFKMLQDKKYFNEQANKYNINVIVFSPIEYPQFSRAFLTSLVDDSLWAPVFWDGSVVIFVKNTKENENITGEKKQIKAMLLRALR